MVAREKQEIKLLRLRTNLPPPPRALKQMFHDEKKKMAELIVKMKKSVSVTCFNRLWNKNERPRANIETLNIKHLTFIGHLVFPTRGGGDVRPSIKAS